MLIINFEHVSRSHHVQKLRNRGVYKLLYTYYIRKKVYLGKVKDRVIRHNTKETGVFLKDAFPKVFIASETFWYNAKYK